MNPLKWIVTNATHRGLSRTLTVGLSYAEDYLFDWRHGTDTIRRVEVGTLDFEASTKAQAKTYGATKARPFLHLMRLLDLPKDATFVDIGSGKGRVLMLACQAGFKRIVGIDFSPQLCEIAQRNLATFRKRTPVGAEVQILKLDATDYEFSADQQIFFMFDPFLPEVVTQVIKNLGRSIERHPRKCWLIYLAPKYHAAIAETKVFPAPKQFTLYGADYNVYVN